MSWQGKAPILAVFATGVLSSAVYVTAPVASGWGVGAWLAPYVLAAAVLAVRFRRRAVRRMRLPLGLLLVAALLDLAAALAWYRWQAALGHAPAFPSPFDAVFLTVYALQGGFLLLLLRRHTGHRVAGNRIAALDSLLFTAAGFALLWVWVLDPELDHATSAAAATVAVLYSTITLLLMGVAARLVLTAGFFASGVGPLILIWLGAQVLGDSIYAAGSARGDFSYGGPVMLTWMVAYTALAALTAHPALPSLTPTGTTFGRAGGAEARAGRAVRPAALLAAALLPLALTGVSDEPGVLLWVAAASATLVICRVTVLAGDLGEQRRLAAALARSTAELRGQRDQLARYAAVVDSTDDALLIADLDGVILDCNRAAETLFGHPRQAMMGRPVAAVAEAIDPQEFATGIARATEQGHAALEVSGFRPDGSPVQISVAVSAIVADSTIAAGSGRVGAVVAVCRDITELMALQAQLHQESKLESLGRLSAGLAHEINSPIQFVGDNARFLQEAYTELIAVVNFYRELLDTANPISWAERQERIRQAEAGIDFHFLQEEIPSAVAQTLDGIERVSTIVRAMKTFSHPGHKEQAYADLNESLAAAVTVTGYQLKDVAALDLRLGDLPPVRCNVADLNQVFLNLVVNAADAVEDTGRRGRITITTERDGDDAIVSITDTGTGIPDDTRAKIFEPFFTTKDVGRGSGQGLPLARAIVQEGHGGTLTVTSAVGEGSTFTVRLPIAGRQRTEPMAAVS